MCRIGANEIRDLCGNSLKPQNEMNEYTTQAAFIRSVMYIKTGEAECSAQIFNFVFQSRE